MFEGFIKKKGQLGYKYPLRRDMSYLQKKTHSNSKKYVSDIIEMTKILLKNIFVIIRARVSFIKVGYVTDKYYYNILINTFIDYL
jgi:hypothetical protein